MKNADNIIDDVFNELCDKMKNAILQEEEILLGINLVMVDAFMRCKILEAPPIQ